MSSWIVLAACCALSAPPTETPMSKSLKQSSLSMSATTRPTGPTGATRDLTRGLGNAAMLERLRASGGQALASAEQPGPPMVEQGAPAAEQRDPAAVVEAFYTAFARRDGAAMGALYHPDATFSDPVFGSLRGAEIGAMWTMLCDSAPDLSVKHSGVAPDGSAAHWDATYTFPATGMPVRNSVDARFVVRDGLILEHVDSFDLYRWSGQALGVVGWLFGWTPFFRDKMTQASRAQLHEWQEARRAEE